MNKAILISLFFSFFVAFSFSNSCDFYSNSTCTECTVNNCNWCVKYMGTSFCTSISNNVAANCSYSGPDGGDIFRTSPVDCIGGTCSTAEYCSGCTTPPYVAAGCRYCFYPTQICFSPNSSSISCAYSTFGTCQVTCSGHFYCGDCITNGCYWCSNSTNPFVGYCTANGNSTDGNSTLCSNVRNIKCPLPVSNSNTFSVSCLTISVFVALISFLFWG